MSLVSIISVYAEIASPPGVVVNHSPKSSEIFVGSPGICILPNGNYLISHDESGPGTVGYPNVTKIFLSTDKGLTWNQISTINGQTWSNIFEYNGDVYLMGVVAPISHCIIRKSTDNGITWTTPNDANSGLLISGKYHTSAVPMVIHNGRIWRAMEAKSSLLSVWPKMYNAMIMSAPLGSDLLKANSWTKSNQLSYDSTYLEGNFGGWLEGNMVLDNQGNMKLIMRVELPGNMDEYAAKIDCESDGKTISFNPTSGFNKMPGAAKKFTIRYDPVSRKYLTLSNYVTPTLKTMTPGYVRNSLALCSSEDLQNWKVDEIILQHDDVKFHGFQYVDWLIEGNDIIFVSRTAYDDEFGGADTYHNSNYITFHRIKNYINLLTDDSSLIKDYSFEMSDLTKIYTQTTPLILYDVWASHIDQTLSTNTTLTTGSDLERSKVGQMSNATLNIPNSNAWKAFIAQRIQNVADPSLYRISFWAKTLVGNSTIRVFVKINGTTNKFFIFDSGKPTEPTGSYTAFCKNLPLTSDWQYFEHVLDFSKTTTTMGSIAYNSAVASTTDDLTNFSVCLQNNAANSTMQVDDVILKKVYNTSLNTSLLTFENIKISIYNKNIDIEGIYGRIDLIDLFGRHVQSRNIMGSGTMLVENAGFYILKTAQSARKILIQ